MSKGRADQQRLALQRQRRLRCGGSGTSGSLLVRYRSGGDPHEGEPDPRGRDAADDRLPDAAGRAGGAGNPVAALGRSMAVPDLRQSDESIYRGTPCQNYRRSFHFHTVPVFRISASRIMQWGGEGRPQSLSSFWDGFTGKTIPERITSRGNQLAGFDFKFKLSQLSAGRSVSTDR